MLFQPILYYLLNSKLPALNGARGVHLKLCLGSHILILIFQSSVVADDYIKVAIKEVQMFNQDVIPPNYDAWFSQVYVTNCFINDDQKEHLLTLLCGSTLSLVYFVKHGETS